MAVTDSDARTAGAAPADSADPTPQPDPLPEGCGIIEKDPWLAPFKDEIKRRYDATKTQIDHIIETEGSLDKFSRGYEKFGFAVAPNGDVHYREWAPNAVAAALVGDFNGWDAAANPMQRDDFGVWATTVPAGKGGQCSIPHDSKVK
ncbi:alpha-1,4-glucan branching enzyme, partial [Ascosphaera acerosa]